MPVFVTRRSIARPPAAVWPVLADVLRWPEWTSSIERVEPLGAPALAVGARYRVFQPKLRPAVFTVTHCEPPHAFTWEMSSAGMGAVAQHVLEPAGGGSMLLLRLEYTGPLGGLVGWLARSLTEDYMNREASGLQKRCETGA